MENQRELNVKLSFFKIKRREREMAKIYGLGQLTLTDLNDAIISGTPPANPTTGALWIDESVSPKLLKKWNGTTWQVLGEVSNEGTGATIIEITETLGNMANDNLIDYNERKVIKDKLTDIIGYVMADTTSTLPTTTTLDAGAKGNFYMYRRRALDAGISSTEAKYVDVATKYNSLKSYLDGLTPIKPWDLRTANQKTNITVTKATFRDKWLQYYLALEDLAEATTAKLKENVDNVQIGGTNYASNGDFSTLLTSARWKDSYVGQLKEIVDISTETPPFRFAYHVKNTSNANGGIAMTTLFEGSQAEALVDKEITISFWLKYQNIVQGANASNAGRFGELVIEGLTSAGAKVYRYPRVIGGESTYVTGTNTTWTKYSATIKLNLPTSATKLSKISFKHVLEGCAGEFWTTGIKIEIGNKATDWSENPLDLQGRITNVEQKVTPESIVSTVSESSTWAQTIGGINTKIDGIEIGGRNLLRNSTFNLGTWSTNSYVTVLKPESDKPNSKITEISHTSSSAVNSPLYNPIRMYLEPKAGDNITFSLDLFYEEDKYKPTSTVLTFRRFANQTDGDYVATVTSPNLTNLGIAESGKWVRGKQTYTFTESTAVAGWYSLGMYLSNVGGNTVKYRYRELQVEWGNKATTWTPAPEDVQQQIDNVQVGGRNLLKDSQLTPMQTNNSTTHPISQEEKTEIERKFTRIKRTSTTTNPTIMSLYNTINMSAVTQELKGNTITFSFRARTSHTTTSTLMFYFQNSDSTVTYYPVGTSEQNTFSLTREWKTYSWTVDFTNSNSLYTRIRFSPYLISIPNGTINDFYLDICEWKFEVGTRATDWIPAVEDVNSLISAVNETATSAKSATDDMMSDLKVTPLEKNELSRLWERIKSEYTQLNAQAVALGVASATRTAYTNAYNALNSTAPRIQTDILANMTTTYTFTTTTRDNFKTQMNTYFTQVETISRAITDVINGKADKLEAQTGNLVKNPALTGNASGWNATGLTTEAVDFFGTNITAFKETNAHATNGTQVYSDYFDVDPAKMYEVSVWFKSTVPLNNEGSTYLGLNGLTDTGATAQFERIAVSNGVVQTATDSNFYFWSTTDTASLADWVKVTGYILPSGFEAERALNMSNSATSVARMKANTRRVRVRWLNYYNYGVERTVWVANPKVVEIPSEATTDGQITLIGQKISGVEQQLTASGISTIITESTFYEEYQSQMASKADSDAIGDLATKDEVADLSNQVDDKITNAIGGIDFEPYATKLDLEETSKNITAKFSATGGMNLLKNSVGYSEFISKTIADKGERQDWFTQGTSSRISRLQTTAFDTLGFGSGFQFLPGTSTQSASIDQYVNVVPNQTYTLSWYIDINNSDSSNGYVDFYVYEQGTSTQIDITKEDGTTTNKYQYASSFTTTGFQVNYFTFKPKVNKVHLRIFGAGLANFQLSGLMMTIGDIPLAWSLATGETYNTNVRLDINGIRVSQLDADRTEIGYTQISPDEFAGYYSTGNGTYEKVFYLNGDETVTKKLRATEEITMGTIKIIKVEAGGNMGWAFVPIVT